MNPYSLFKLCMNVQGRTYKATEEEFNDSKYFNFFYMLTKYFKTQLKFNDTKVKQFVSIIFHLHPNDFDPWKLNSPDYLEDFKAWYKVNSSRDAYIENVRESFRDIVKFCKQKNIKRLDEYIKSWGVTHYINGKLNDNVAYVLKLHEQTLSKPEKFMIKRFLKNVPMIKERIEREGRLKTVIEEEVQHATKSLFWIS